MLRSRFDRTKTGLAGLWVAVAISGCANVGQQGASADNAASGVPAAAAMPASGVTVPTQQPADDALTTRTVTTTKTIHYRVKRGDTLAGTVRDSLRFSKRAAESKSD